MATRHAIISRNAALNAVAPLCNTGYLRFYTGAQPATPETAASGTLLCTLRMNATAFPAASGGVNADELEATIAAVLLEL